MKKRGFTLIELIITLSITVIALGIIYSFIRTSSRIIIKTEINSILQEEAETIQRYLASYGMQAEDLVEINNKIINSSEDFDYENMLLPNGKIELEEIKLKSDDYFYELYCDDRELVIRKLNHNHSEIKENEFPKILSKNIEKINFRLIYKNMNEQKKLEDTRGIEFSIILKMKKGSVEESVPLSGIIKFRNK